MSRGRWLTIGALVALMVAVLTGCASDAPLDTMEPKGTFSERIDGLFNTVMIVAAVVFVLVQGGILFLMARFRRRNDDDDSLPSQVHGNFALEIGWTILPAVILAVITVPTVAVLFELNEEPEGDFADCIVVNGQQWWWSFDYYVDDPDCGENEDGQQVRQPDIVTANELVVPSGTEIELVIRSRDVIHSFWIPALNGKRDAVPGRTANWLIQADEPGTYQGQCTEFCGLSHGLMRMQAKAVTAADYDAWKTAQMAPAETPAEGTSAAAGAELFAAQCARCHTVRDAELPTYDDVAADRADNPVLLVPGVAPDLTHFASREWFRGGVEELWLNGAPGEGQFNRVAVEEWLRNPTEVKAMAADPAEYPGSEVDLGRGMPDLNLSEAQIDELTDYLMGLE
jgi:cytochrome c oxidase subunit 2